MSPKPLPLICLLIILASNFSCKKKDPANIDPIADKRLFIHGKNGYKYYRIPALLTTSQGTLLAFCEGRKNGLHDSGKIDVIYRRSMDNGNTWSNQEIIFQDGDNSCQNPCAVQDSETGTIWLFMCHNLGTDNETTIINRTSYGPRTVWACYSNNDGVNWSTPQEVTSVTKDPEWDWYGTGPGIGIQIKNGINKGRLIIPCYHSYYPNNIYKANGFTYGSHVIYSDDHGSTWHHGGTCGPKSNESQVVEIPNGTGTLLINSKIYNGVRRRAQSYSYDGGVSWTKPVSISSLPDPICEASIITYVSTTDTSKKIFMFSNPADTASRINLTLKFSLDNGNSWSYLKTINSGPSAYSSLTVMKNSKIACLYETGAVSAYESIIFDGEVYPPYAF